MAKRAEDMDGVGEAVKTSVALTEVKYEIRGQLAHRAHELERLGYEIISLNPAGVFTSHARLSSTASKAVSTSACESRWARCTH